ncbi:MAG: hypothetical protein BMS9Abin05_1385 [Rhodothermia bacterium]|nr:MAG: hypothetical protein BMS9Abin05_1385 [Rhodothermia bacterium]
MSNLIKQSNPIAWLLDPVKPTADQADSSYRFSWSQVAWLLPIGLGTAALVVSAVGWAMNAEQFYFSYLIAWVFCVSIALGGLFFVLVHHLTQARWSVVVRRISEALIWSFPILAVLSIPLLFGLHDLYQWTDADLFDPASPSYDAVIAGKELYLNIPFFLGRAAFYFLIWSTVSYKLYTTSIRQDLDGDPEIPGLQRKTSAWGLVLVSLTTGFAGFDFLMSLDPHWFSTIFGVYFFSGSFMVVMAFIALVAMILQKAGMLQGSITTEHYQDLGKFLFGFVVFWAYIAFSQYMLIWYGNMPEETIFYRDRLEQGWEVYSAVLLIAHFLIPFVVLISRPAKRMIPLLGFMSVWMLVVHWFDFFWLAMPVLHEQPTFHFLDLTTAVGLFGVMAGIVLYRLSRHSLIPEKDPYLEESLAFTNS